MVDFAERLLRFRSANFPSLRRSQERVLQEYADNHLETDDLAIEMPTGEGKTLVALLIADHALDDRRSVAYLTGTRQLTEQVSRESELLGLPSVEFSAQNYPPSALSDYHDAQVLAIMNYWVYFNSRPVPRPADLIILDDAHLAEQPLTGLDVLRIDIKSERSFELYQSLCDIVTAHSNLYSSVKAMRDGNADPTTPPELIAFSHWSTIHSSFRDCIQESAIVSDSESRYIWPRVRDHLSKCCVIVSPTAIEIRPYLPLTTLNESYTGATQRVYLSATLGSMDDLQRRIGGHQIQRLNYASDGSTHATGKRRLILNPEMNSIFESSVFRWVLSQITDAQGRAAWLCSSTAEADEIEKRLQEDGQTVFRLRPGNDSAISDWATAPHGNLIGAGRYDGLDLTGDICHLVIIPSIPQSTGDFERFITSHVGDATFVDQRIGQRITQALGRANRTPDDYALYIGVDPRFGHMLANPEVQGSIPSDLKSEVNAALALHDQGMSATNRACDEFWREETVGDGEGSQASTDSRRRRPGRRTQREPDTQTATDEIAAVTELWIGGYRKAAAAASTVSDTLADSGRLEHSAFWRYIEAHAHHCHGGGRDVQAAISSLRSATESGPRTAWFRRLERIAEELAGCAPEVGSLDNLFLAWDEWIREFGSERMLQHLSGARSNLQGTHDQQCEALEIIAQLCGAFGKRPRKPEQAAPDCVWSWHARRREHRRVWEVKTGNIERVPRDHINQVLGQIEVESDRAPSARVSGCLLTSATDVRADARQAAHGRVAIVHRDALLRMVDLMVDRFRRYASDCGEGDAQSRGHARSSLERILPQHNWLQQVLKPSQGRIRSTDEIERLFP